jgi:hypothetical protein
MTQESTVLFNALGTVCRVTAAVEDALLYHVRDWVCTLDSHASLFQPDSDVSRLNRAAGQEAVPVTDDIAAVLKAAQQCSRWSQGAFSVTAGPLASLWRQGAPHRNHAGSCGAGTGGSSRRRRGAGGRGTNGTAACVSAPCRPVGRFRRHCQRIRSGSCCSLPSYGRSDSVLHRFWRDPGRAGAAPDYFHPAPAARRHRQYGGPVRAGYSGRHVRHLRAVAAGRDIPPPPYHRLPYRPSCRGGTVQCHFAGAIRHVPRCRGHGLYRSGTVGFLNVLRRLPGPPAEAVFVTDSYDVLATPGLQGNLRLRPASSFAPSGPERRKE